MKSQGHELWELQGIRAERRVRRELLGSQADEELKDILPVLGLDQSATDLRESL